MQVFNDQCYRTAFPTFLQKREFVKHKEMITSIKSLLNTHYMLSTGPNPGEGKRGGGEMASASGAHFLTGRRA